MLPCKLRCTLLVEVSDDFEAALLGRGVGPAASDNSSSDNRYS
jgi:hypothetical protein